MVTLVRVARVLLLLVLAVVTVTLVIGLANGDTGVAEKVVLVGLIAGCIYLAARLSTWAELVQERLSTH